MNPDSAVIVGSSRDDRVSILMSIITRPKGGVGVSKSILLTGGNVEFNIGVAGGVLFVVCGDGGDSSDGSVTR